MTTRTRALAVAAFRLAQDAVTVTVGSTTTYGVFDEAVEMVNDGTGEPLRIDTREVHVAAESLSGVTDGATVLIDGASYTVRGRPRPRENGDLWSISVTRL